MSYLFSNEAINAAVMTSRAVCSRMTSSSTVTTVMGVARQLHPMTSSRRRLNSNRYTNESSSIGRTTSYDVAYDDDRDSDGCSHTCLSAPTSRLYDRATTEIRSISSVASSEYLARCQDFLSVASITATVVRLMR